MTCHRWTGCVSPSRQTSRRIEGTCTSAKQKHGGGGKEGELWRCCACRQTEKHGVYTACTLQRNDSIIVTSFGNRLVQNMRIAKIVEINCCARKLICLNRFRHGTKSACRKHYYYIFCRYLGHPTTPRKHLNINYVQLFRETKDHHCHHHRHENT